jgi:aminoacyl tRNA synthase complex-interacting multifunctional protein 1
MATATLDEPTLSLLSKSFSTLTLDPTTSASKLSAVAFPDAKYTDAEKGEIDQWVIAASHVSDSSDAAKSAERLSTLNRHLATRTTILGSKPSVADVAVYLHVAPLVKGWSGEERTGERGYHHIVRHVDFVQNSSVFDLKIEDADKVKVDADDVVFVLKPVDVKAEKARLKKEKEDAAKAAAAGSGSATAEATPATTEAEGKKSKKQQGKEKLEAVADAVSSAVPLAKDGSAAQQQQPKPKKEKKEKAPKPQKAAPVEKPLSPSLIDLRVGHILKCVQHPDAEKLFVSTMAVGDAPGTDNTTEYEGQTVRTVCSGLNGLIPLEEMQNRKIVAVCNLKPVTMRGVKSSAMVLAASPRDDDSHAGPVELVSPPAEAKAGERVFFEGWEGEPEPVLNPKKKVWETIQPGFTTTEDLTAAFNVEDVEPLKAQGKTGVGKLRTKEGFCVVKTLKGATIR